MEIVRVDLQTFESKRRWLMMESGHLYWNLRRTSGEYRSLAEYVCNARSVMENETRTLHAIHSKKWLRLCDFKYPISFDMYKCELQPCFPYKINIENKINKHATTDIKFANETGLEVPDAVKDLLNKGPKYRLPNNIDKKFWDKISMNFETLRYNMRWSSKLKDKLINEADDGLIVPFDKNTCRLPPKMKEEMENKLICFGNDLKEILDCETSKFRKTKEFRDINKKCKMTKEFLRNNNLQCVRSDKTNKFVLCKADDLMKKNELILQDTATYVAVKESKTQAIENQANKLIKHVIKDSPLMNQSEKLISTGTNPATFFSFIKDHKDRKEDGFPVRPIASVRNTPIEKIDWIVSRILSQSLSLVPAHLMNTDDLLSLLNNLNNIKSKEVFISLDVQSLYPSIPLEIGIEYNLKHLKSNWDKIVNFGISIENIEKMLRFVCYNYEISYNSKTYKQVKGVPMGCHFAPPFAIIFLHEIESKAIQLLRKLDINPPIYKRYIDDVILGPLKHDETIFRNVLEIFNSINPDIKFTLEAPQPEHWLTFLDIKIKIDNGNIKYSWHHKQCHSNIALRKDSFLPRHMKSNYIRNSFNTISNRSSDEEIRNENLADFDKILEQNAYSMHERQIDTAKKSFKTTNENDINFKIPFVNDQCNRKIKKLIKKYKLPIKLINEFGHQSASHLGNNKGYRKDCPCNVCKDLQTCKYSCRDRFVVYRYTCIQCGDFYIGKTARMLKTRHHEHKKAIENKSCNSALYTHLMNKHGGIGGIGSFQVGLVRKLFNTRDTTIAEAKAITHLKPAINRRHELPDYNLSSQFDRHSFSQHTP